MTRHVLGVDAGGSKTLAVIADEGGRVLGVGSGGPGNFRAVGVEASQGAIRAAVRSAAEAAGRPAQGFDAAFLGIAGALTAEDRAIARQMAAELAVADEAHTGVDHDGITALVGGLGGVPGIALIVGTGSVCFGINAAGECWQAGGWGHLISDEGSGHWLGLAAMRAAIMAYDGRGPRTLLEAAVMQALDMGDMTEIVQRIYMPELSKAQAAALGPLVLECAAQGDAVAQALLQTAARDLAACVQAVALRLGLADGPFPLVLVGGMVQHRPELAQRVAEAVRGLLPQCRAAPPLLSPALGACVLALQQLGVRCDEALLARLSARY